MVCISLKEAAQIVDAALEKGHELGLAPLTVVVLDPGGYPVAIKREDGSGLLRCDVATAKAWGPLAMGWGGKELVERANRAPAFFSALTTLSGRVRLHESCQRPADEVIEEIFRRVRATSQQGGETSPG